MKREVAQRQGIATTELSLRNSPPFSPPMFTAIELRLLESMAALLLQLEREDL